MKKFRRKLRQSLAGFLAFCLTMTSFNMVSWADVEKAFDNRNAIFMINGEELRNSAQAAIDAGETFLADDLGLGDEDQSLKREYEKLFGKGHVYEFSPDYYLDEEAGADGAELRMFIRTADTDGEYLLTGDEEIIFLYLNESDEKITFRSNIDGYLTQKVSVKAFSEGTAAIPSVPEVQPEIPVPDEGVVNPEETEAEEESEAVDETEGARETGDTEETGSTEETEENGNVEESSEAEDVEKGSEAESGSEETANDEGQADPEESSDDADTGSEDSDAGSSDAGGSETEDSDTGSSDEGSGTQASISRHILSVLTSSDVTALEEGTPSEAEPEVEEDEKPEVLGTTKGKTYGAVLLDESYYAKAYVTTLNQLNVDTMTEGYRVTYSVEPIGTAYAEGPKVVEENEMLSFKVTPQVGYEISSVTVNGEVVEADEAGDGTTLSYTVEEVAEEQEVVIVTAATGEHPEFSASIPMEDGTVIHIYAAEGVLPAGVKAVASVVKGIEDVIKENVEDDAEAAGEEKEVITSLSYNIDLLDQNGSKLDDRIWGGVVEVTFTGNLIERHSKEADTVEVIYVATSKEDETQAEITATDVLSVQSVSEIVNIAGDESVSEVAFDAEHFSVYTVMFANTGRDKQQKVYVEDTKGNNIGNGSGTSVISLGEGEKEVDDIAAEIKSSDSSLDIYEFKSATVGGRTTQKLRWESGKAQYLYKRFLLGDKWADIGDKKVEFKFEELPHVTFDPNGGIGASRKINITNGTLSLPLPETIGIQNPNGKIFVGWSTQKTGQGSNYIANYQLTGIQNKSTFYAIWLNPSANTSFKAYFYVRTGDEIFFEPASYDTKYFYPKDGKEIERNAGSIRELIAVNNSLDNVKRNILTSPTNAKWEEIINAEGGSFNKDTQEIVWYVIKKQGNGTWHVDGVIQSKETRSVIYNPNNGDSNIPAIKQYAKGTSVSVDFNTVPSRVGYTFAGWDTNREALPDNVRYSVNASRPVKFIMSNEDVNLYAIWKPQGNTSYKVEYYYQENGTYTTAYSSHTRSGTTGATVEVDANDKLPKIPDYVFDKDAGYVLSGTISGDGTLRLKVYFKQQFTVTYRSGTQGNFEVQTKPGLDYNANTPAFEGTPVGKSGYTFEKWSPDVAVKVTDHAEYVAQWKAKNDIVYKVEYYYQNNGKYTTADSIDTRSGTTGVTVEVTTDDILPNKPDYVYDRDAESILRGSIAGDGSLILKVYFKQQFKVIYMPGTQGTFDNQTKTDLDFNANTPKFEGTPVGKPGYIFEKWSPDVTDKVTDHAEYVAQWKADSVIFKVNHYLQKPNTVGNQASDFTLDLSSPVIMAALTGSIVVDEANKREFEGYWYEEGIIDGVTSETVNGDGSSALNLYYLKKNSITVTAKILTKVYDGTALTGGVDGYTQEGTLREGDTLKVVLSGSVINVSEGTVVSRIENIIIQNGNNDVTDKYDVTKTNGTLTITPAKVIITADDKTKEYGSVTPELTYKGPEGLIGHDTLDLEIMPTTEADETSIPGKYDISFKNPVTESGNYVIDYVPGVLTVGGYTGAVKITAKSKSKDYDGTPLINNDYDASGLIDGHKLADVSMTTDSTITNAGNKDNEIGSYKIHDAKGNDVTEHYKNIETKKGTLTINKLTAKVIAKDISKGYGKSIPPFNYSIEGFLKNELPEDLRGRIKLTTNAFEKSPVGIYDINFAEEPEVANYNIEYVPAKLTVTRNMDLIIIKASDAIKVYDGKELRSSRYEVFGRLVKGDKIVGVTMTDDSARTNAGKTDNVINRDTIQIMDGNIDVTANYGNVKTVKGTLFITKAVAAVIAKSASKVYGETNPELTYETSGFVEGEDLAGLGITPELKTTAETNSPQGIHAITFNNPKISTDNYVIVYINGMLTIKKNAEEIVIQANSDTKVYDGTPLTNDKYTLMGTLAEGDYIAAVNMSASSGITTVGEQSNEILSVVIKNAAGKDVTRNYSSLTFAPGTLIVSKAQLTVTAINETKAYGEENPVLRYEVTGYPKDGAPLEESYEEAIALSTTAKKNSPIGNYPITLTKPESEPKNYTVIYVNGNLSVTQSENTLVVIASDAEKVYDGTELTKAEYRVVGSLRPGDRIAKVVMTEDSKITNAGIQANKISGIVIENEAGEDVTNGYGLEVTDGTLTVRKASITVSAANKSKTRGNANPNLTYVIRGLINGETIETLGFNPQLMTAANQNSVAGTYSITFMNPVSTLDNYNIIYENGVLTIAPITTGGGSSGGSGGGSSPGSNTPFVPEGPGSLVTIDPGQVPLAGLPEENAANQLILIEENYIPLAGLPKTGDRSVMPSLAAIISGVLLAAYAMITGKRKEEN